MHSSDPIAPVAYLKLLKYHLEPKPDAVHAQAHSHAENYQQQANDRHSSPSVFYLQPSPLDFPSNPPSSSLHSPPISASSLSISAGASANESQQQQAKARSLFMALPAGQNVTNVTDSITEQVRQLMQQAAGKINLFNNFRKCYMSCYSHITPHS